MTYLIAAVAMTLNVLEGHLHITKKPFQVQFVCIYGACRGLCASIEVLFIVRHVKILVGMNHGAIVLTIHCTF